MAITEQNVCEYINNIGGEAGINATVWAVKMPSVFNMAVFGPMANLFDLRYNLMHVADNEIIIIGVDNAGRLTPLHVRISGNEIQDIKIKKKLTGCVVEIVTSNGSLKYNINKVMIGSSFHKENYEKTISLLGSFK